MKTKQLQIGKYVIVNDMPVLFPLEVMHSNTVVNGQSAGFFVIRINSFDIDVYCWGESTSLNLVSNPEQDAYIIKDFISTVSTSFQKYIPGAQQQISSSVNPLPIQCI